MKQVLEFIEMYKNVMIVGLLFLIFLVTCNNGANRIKNTIITENQKTIDTIKTSLNVYIDENLFSKKVDSIMDIKMKKFLIIEDKIDKKQMKIEDL